MTMRWVRPAKSRYRDRVVRDARRRAGRRHPARRLAAEWLEDRRLLALLTTDFNGGLTPDDLVQSLIGGGLSVSNVSYTGANSAGGLFEGGVSEGLGIDAGVILSSGTIADAAGPNNSENISSDFFLPGDPDLDGLIPGFTTNDAAVLEFDFVAVGDTLNFNYVFGSEEYNEFVGSSFNDVFGFFLDGQNVALIPGTSTPVSINNLNNGLNSSFYNDNSPTDLGIPTPFLTQADGFTVVLTATASLSPGSHHIKLATADAGDTALDSWVFLQAESFVSGDADMSVSISDSLDPAVVNDPFTYTVTASNNGPDPATGIVVQDTLPAGVTFVSATASQGSVTESGGVITAELGLLSAGGTASVSITVIPTQLGTITNTATIEALQTDDFQDNNSASEDTLVDIPHASVSDLLIIEGNAGTQAAVFSVSLNGPLTNSTGSLGYATFDGTAHGGSDFIPTGGTLTFPPGVSQRTVTVPIIGDVFNEVTENFHLQLGNPVNVKIDNFGTGTIIDNDLVPALYVDDVQVTTTEADVLEATFTVALDVPSGRTVSVAYATADGTALANTDYLSQSGVLQFPPGVNTMQVTVPVLTSALYGPNELFSLQLSNATSALLADPVGVCTSVFAPPPPTEYFVDDGDAGYSQNAGWSNVTNLVAYQSDYDYRAAGTGAGTATWSVHDVLDGTYQVFTRWVPFSNRATNAPYTVLDGATPRGTVRVNQQVAPSGDYDNGIVWQSLGMYQITSGTITVRLSDDANGIVVADAVRLVRGGIPPQAPEIDISQWGHSIGNNDTSATLEDGTHFGSVLATAYSTTRTFTIKNTGNADLHLTGSPAVQLTGINPGEFIIESQPSVTTLAPGGTTSFDVIFHPATTGLRQAIVSVASDDADEPLYQFAIEGLGIDDLVPLSTAQNALQPLDVDDNSIVSARDALLVINSLLRDSAAGGAISPLAATMDDSTATTLDEPFYYLDVDGSGVVSAHDALLVINHLISQATAASASVVISYSATTLDEVQVFAIDEAISQLTAPQTSVALEPVVAAGTPTATAQPAETKALLEPSDATTSLDADGTEADDTLPLLAALHRDSA